MAVTGAILFLFVIAHLWGSLKVFQGQAKLDEYGEFLREVGGPVFGHGQILWITRLSLIAAVLLHITSAVQIARMNRAARPERYRRLHHNTSDYASRTMIWGGVIIVAFVIYHLLHFTFGTVHPDFEAGAVYNNTILAFQSWLVVLAYVVAVLALGFHLYHGLWSALQTLGVNHPRVNRVRRVLAIFMAVAVTIGYISIPLGVITGVLS